MSASFQQRFRRSIASLPTFFSITIVLFLAGLFGIVIIKGYRIRQIMKENIVVRIIFREDVKDEDMKAMQRKFASESYVKSAEFISKEQGLKKLEAEQGENIAQMLGYNPLPNSIDLYFRANYVQPDSLHRLKELLEKNDTRVREVYYLEAIVNQIDRLQNITSVVLLSLACVMGFVSIILIYNTIRLTLYARRFLIKSMQLVGATQGFIRRPFLWRSMLMGLAAGVLACALIGIMLLVMLRLYPMQDMPELMKDNSLTVILFFAVILLGILICTLSSYFAVNKYLKMKLDNLF